MDEYYIEAGVHRAVAAREAGLSEIEAVLHVPGVPPVAMTVRLDSLHVNRVTVTRRVTRRRNLPGLLVALADPVARAKVPPIQLQRLGEFGQPRLVPLRLVTITDDPEEELP